MEKENKKKMEKENEIGLIASDIASMSVIKVDYDDSIMSVITLMDKHQISAIMVVDARKKQKKYYIISHGDIIHFFTHSKEYRHSLLIMGIDLLKATKAGDICRGPLDVIAKDTAIDEIMRIMFSKGWKRLFIGEEEGGDPTGIISTKDILSWNNDFFKKGTPILLAILENKSGLILAKKFFKDAFGEELLELFGGSLSAISAITSEVLKKSGDLRIIEKDYYVIMIEPSEVVSAILIADHASLDLRKNMQIFLADFTTRYKKALDRRKKGPSAISDFKIEECTLLFET